jgi:broad specificity phosphatase PhoE
VRPRWTQGPSRLVVVRHGHSVGNEADSRAHEAGAETLDLDARDADVELSDTGREQARALGRWLTEQPHAVRPSYVACSPYVRARTTAELAVGELDGGPTVDLDERLRERDLGTLNGLTGAGIRKRHPEEATRREELGKFYYQPPSGESWADVAFRVRAFLGDLRHGFEGERIWVFTHEAVIMTFRYVLDGLSEEEILDLDREMRIPNGSMTTFVQRGQWLELESFAEATPVEKSSAEVTYESSKAART